MIIRQQKNEEISKNDDISVFTSALRTKQYTGMTIHILEGQAKSLLPALMSSNHIWMQLFQYAKTEVIFPCWTEALTSNVHLVKHLDADCSADQSEDCNRSCLAPIE